MHRVRRLLNAICVGSFGAVLVFGVASTAQAVIKVEHSLTQNDPQLFPKPPIVRKQVRFWEKIFSKYSSTTMVIHDVDDLDHIVDLIDFSTFGKQNLKDPTLARKDRDLVARKYLKRYSQAVTRFRREGKKALRHGAIEKRLYLIYGASPASLKRLYGGQVKLRAQSGLADDFRSAASTAAAYFPYMERVFSQHGVPTHVTRLAFVESMFNVNARSKVGASGLWQFMPQTARHYVYVNRLVDERNSPYKATRAAAQFLQDNYRELGSWPLAITAYNHGRQGMARAVKQLATNDIGRIIQKYESRSFGFASRNFYAEFLAAVNTYERLQRTGAVTKPSPLPDTVPVILKEPISVRNLLARTPLTKEMLAEHNPCLLESAFGSDAHRPLPSFYEIRVPRAMSQAVIAALGRMHDTRYATR